MYLEPNTKIWLTSFANPGTVNSLQTSAFLTKPAGIARTRRLLIPVNPEKLDINAGSNPNTFQILYEGQVQVPQHPNLRSFKWSSFFPEEGSPFAPGGTLAPGEYVDFIKSELDNARVLELTIYGPNISISTPVTVKSFQTSFEGGPNEIQYSIELLEWKNYAPKKLVIKTDAQGNNTATEEDQRPNNTSTPRAAVGVKVIANGAYCYDSYGSKPHGNAKNLSTTITRIVQNPKSGQDYTIHIGNYGWTKLSNLQIKE